MGIEGISFLNSNECEDLLAKRSTGFETLQSLQRFVPSLSEPPQHNYHETKYFTTIFSVDTQTNFLGRARLDLNILTNQNVTQIASLLTNHLSTEVVQKYTWPDWLQFSANLKDYLDSDPTPSNDGITLTDGADSIPLLGREAVPLIYAVSDEISIYRMANWTIARAIDVYAINLSSKSYSFPTGCLVSVEGLPDVIISNYYSVGPSRKLTVSYTNASMIVPSANECHKIAFFSSGFRHDPSSDNMAYLNRDGDLLRQNAGTPQGRVIQGYGHVSNVAQIYYRGIVISTNFPSLNYTGTRFSLSSYTNTIRVLLSGPTGILDEAHIAYDAFTSNVYPPSVNYFAGNIFWPKAPGDPRIPKLKSTWATASYSSLDSGLSFDGKFYSYSDAPWVGPSSISSQTNSSAYFGDINSDDALAFGDHGFFVRDGPIQSIGEIGQIPIQSVGTSNMWRTLKLYGDGNRTPGLTNSEDYFVLDHIRVGLPSRSKINLNTTKEHLNSSQGVLTALFRKSSIPSDAGGTESSFQALDENPSVDIFPFTTNVVATAQKWGPYRSIGHYLQQNAPALAGVATNQITDWRREGPMRSIVNALTVRGEQFTIYGLGQSVKNIQGNLKVQGESYSQTVVERVTTTSAPPFNVYYRTLYHRSLEE
jgi:hypothetical protein